MGEIAPMLQVLGYDPNANPPNYGQPDEIVLRKTQDIHTNSEVWYKKAVELVNDPSRVDKPVVQEGENTSWYSSIKLRAKSLRYFLISGVPTQACRWNEC